MLPLALDREWLDAKQTQWIADTMTRNKGALEKHIFPIFGKRLFVSIRLIEWMEHPTKTLTFYA